MAGVIGPLKVLECKITPAHQAFLKRLEEKKSRMVGPYLNAKKPVLVECEFHHLFMCIPYKYKVKWCPLEEGSKGEKLLQEALLLLGYTPIHQKSLASLPDLYFDVSITHQGIEYFIEWDGEPHFKFNKFYHRTQEGFQDAQQRDILKTAVALQEGHRILRIDHTWIEEEAEEIAKIIKTALAAKVPLTVSTPEMYQWLTGVPKAHIVARYYKPEACEG